MTVASKTLLLIIRRAPYGDRLGRAAYDLALAAAAFEQPVSVLLMDDGIWHLLPDQKPAAISAKSISSTLDSLPLYDIEIVYADARSMEARGLTAGELRGGVELIVPSKLGDFIEGFDTVVSF